MHDLSMRCWQPHMHTHTHTQEWIFMAPSKKINHSTTLQCSNTTAYYSKKWGTIFMLASKGEWQAALGPENLTNKTTARSNYLLCVRWHLKTFVNSKYKGENYDAVVEFICFILPVCLLSLCSTCGQKWLGSELYVVRLVVPRLSFVRSDISDSVVLTAKHVGIWI